MSLRIRGKLTLVSVFLMLIALVPGSLYLERSLRSRLEERVESELFRHAGAVRETLLLLQDVQDIEQTDQLADRLARALSARVTLIAADGSLVGDSDISTDRVRKADNHGNRPEIIEALDQERGSSRRHSKTLDTDMLYVAIPFERPDQRGVVRIAMPLGEVDRAVAGLRLILLVATGLALILAFVMSALASHFYSLPLKRLIQIAQTAGEGVTGQAESRKPGGKFSGSFNRKSEELRQVVSGVAEQRDRFEAVLEGIDDGVLAIDRAGIITHANLAAIRLLGFGEPPVGRSLSESILVPEVHEMVTSVGPERPAFGEFDLPGEITRRLQASATALRGGGGAVVVFHDVTELRRLETVRQDFVANVSHELRTPVSVIQANSETLLDGAMREPERAREFLEAMHRHASRLASLISDLLDISRIESGQYVLEIGPVSPGAIARLAFESVEGAAKAKELAFEMAVDPELKVLADEKALLQAILNILDNAVKYTPRGGWVTVRTQGDSGFVRIEVQDNGPGIDPSQRDRIFERFYRVDTGRSREMGGTGLGLSIVKNLAEIMGGEAGCEAASPRGSIFWIRLPAVVRGS